MMTADLHRFQVRTHAATRSKAKRTRTWTVDAATAAEACDDAVSLHLQLLAGPGGWYFTGDVIPAVESVDGAPRGADCEHMAADPWQAFTPRWDGGRDCKACASTQAVVR